MDFDLTTAQIIGLLILIIWDLTWKGIALWFAARKGQNAWFIALLVINSMGILPMIYLLLNYSSSEPEKEDTHEKTIPVQG